MGQPAGIDRRETCGTAPVGESRDLPPLVGGLRRVLYVALAAVFLGLGLLGVFLPGVPTTPFLLLMSYFLVRSWPWLHDRVVSLPLIGGPIRDWRENRGVRRPIKAIASLMVLLVVGGTLMSQTVLWPLKTAIAGLATCGLLVVWRLPTIQDGDAATGPSHRDRTS